MTSSTTPTYIADVNQDPDYEHTKVFLKQLTEVSKTLSSSIQKSMTALDNFVASLENVQRAVDQMLGIGLQRRETEILAKINARFESVVHLFRKEELPKTMQYLQHECIEHTQSLSDDQVRVEQLRKDRKKLGEMLESARQDVDEKEKEYQKKNKSLSESKQYGPLKAKYGETERQFMGCMNTFRRESSLLLHRKEHVTAHGLQSFLEHISHIMGGLGMRLYDVFHMTAVHTHPQLYASFSSSKTQLGGATTHTSSSAWIDGTQHHAAARVLPLGTQPPLDPHAL